MKRNGGCTLNILSLIIRLKNVLIFLVVSLLFVSPFFDSPFYTQADSETQTFTQTDWSGGAGTGSNQYESAVTVNTGTEITLAKQSDWWNESYKRRRQVTLTNNHASDSIATGTPIGIKIDTTTSNLTGALTGGSAGNDIRIVYNNATEIDRVLDKGSTWSNASSLIWIKSQAAIAGTGADNKYYVYYDNDGDVSNYTSFDDPADIWTNGQFIMSFNNTTTGADGETPDAGTYPVVYENGQTLEETGSTSYTPQGLTLEATTSNYAYNPSFENNLTDGGWQSGSDITKSQSTSKYSGNNSAKLVAGTSATDTDRAFSFAEILTAVDWTLSFYIKGDASVSDAARIYYNNTKDTTAINITTSWQRVSKSFTGVAELKNFGVIVSASKTVYIDAVQLEANSQASTYADGNLDGSGTAYKWMIPTPQNLAYSVVGGNAGYPIKYSITAFDSGTDTTPLTNDDLETAVSLAIGNEDFPAIAELSPENYVRLTWGRVSGASRYKIYREDLGDTGLIYALDVTDIATYNESTGLYTFDDIGYLESFSEASPPTTSNYVGTEHNSVTVRIASAGNIVYPRLNNTAHGSLLNMAGGLSDDATTITVDSTTGFPATGTINIEDEQITYTGISSNSFTGCTRGANSTTAVSHSDDTPVYTFAFGSISSWVKINNFAPSDANFVTDNNVSIGYQGSSKKLHVTIGETASIANEFIGTTVLNEDTWYHVTVAWGNGDYSVYLNGSIEGSAGTYDTITTYSVNKELVLGASQKSLTMSDLRIYSSKLTADQIGDLAVSRQVSHAEAAADSLYSSATGTLTSRVFDSGWNALWGTVTYDAASNSQTQTIKIRTCINSDMSTATAWDDIDAVALASGTDITTYAAVTSGQRYLQYQITQSTTDQTVSPILRQISITYQSADPVLDISYPWNNMHWNVSDGAISIQGTVDTNEGAAITGVSVSIDSGDYSSATLSNSNTVWTYSWDPADTAATHTIIVRATNSAGSVATTSTMTVYTDTTVVTSRIIEINDDDCWATLPRESDNVQANEYVTYKLVGDMTCYNNITTGSGPAKNVSNDQAPVNLPIQTSGNALTIGANNITIDGNNHIIEGDSIHTIAYDNNDIVKNWADFGDYGIRNSAGYSNITIKNFAAIQKFAYPISMTGASNVSITGNKFSQNINQVINLVSDSVAIGEQTIYYGINNISIKNNTFDNNFLTGIGVTNSYDSEIANNNFFSQHSNPISASTGLSTCPVCSVNDKTSVSDNISINSERGFTGTGDSVDFTDNLFYHSLPGLSYTTYTPGHVDPLGDHNNMITFAEDIDNQIDVNGTASFSFDMTNIVDTDCPTCTYTVKTYPEETVTSSKAGNTVSGSFTATHAGLYSLIAEVTDSNENYSKTKINYIVGNTATEISKYYMHEDNSTHGQPIGQGVLIDGGSLKSSSPLSGEWDMRRCSHYTQVSPDELPDYPIGLLTGIKTALWYREVPYLGAPDDVENPTIRSGGWDWDVNDTNFTSVFGYQLEIADNGQTSSSSTVSNSVANSDSDYDWSVVDGEPQNIDPDYAWHEETFSDIGYMINHPQQWYLLAAKHTTAEGAGPYIASQNPDLSLTDLDTNPYSYVTFTHTYPINPKIKTNSNELVNILSATTSTEGGNDAVIVLDATGLPDSDDSTNITIADYDRAFQGYATTFNSDGSVTIAANDLDGEISISSKPLSIIPPSGTITTEIDTWNTSGTYYKKWTEVGTNVPEEAVVTHTIGDLASLTKYIIKVDGVYLSSATTDSSGNLTFDYNKGYSQHNFEVSSDTTAPSSTPTVTGLTDGSGWYALPPTVSLSATDSGSGLSKIYYKWDNAEYTEYSATLAVPTGEHTLYYYSVDLAGNSEVVSSLNFKVRSSISTTQSETTTISQTIPAVTAADSLQIESSSSGGAEEAISNPSSSALTPSPPNTSKSVQTIPEVEEKSGSNRIPYIIGAMAFVVIVFGLIRLKYSTKD